MQADGHLELILVAWARSLQCPLLRGVALLLVGEVPLRMFTYCLRGSCCKLFIPCKTVLFREREWWFRVVLVTQHRLRPSSACPSMYHFYGTHWICSFSVSFSFKELYHHQIGMHVPPEVTTILSSNLCLLIHLLWCGQKSRVFGLAKPSEVGRKCFPGRYPLDLRSI